MKRESEPPFADDATYQCASALVYTENLIRVDDVMESPKLAE
jgi:hypothetical protein